MNTHVYRNYYEIPTIDGNFYLYREWMDLGTDNINGHRDIKYNDFIEIFTGMACKLGIEELNLNSEMDMQKFNIIRDELAKTNPEIEANTGYDDTICFPTICFPSSNTSSKIFFPSNPNYHDIISHNATYIVGSSDSKYTDFDCFKISAPEFAIKLDNIVEHYGNPDAVKDDILGRLDKQGLLCKEREKALWDYEIKQEMINDEAEKHIKKYLKY